MYLEGDTKMGPEVKETPLILNVFKVHQDTNTSTSKTDHRCRLVVSLGDIGVEILCRIEGKNIGLFSKDALSKQHIGITHVALGLDQLTKDQVAEHSREQLAHMYTLREDFRQHT